MEPERPAGCNRVSVKQNSEISQQCDAACRLIVVRAMISAAAARVERWQAYNVHMHGGGIGITGMPGSSNGCTRWLDYKMALVRLSHGSQNG